VPALSAGAFSVLDPTTTTGDSFACGIAPLELAPPISLATQLLQAYELRRAQELSSEALMIEELSPNSSEGGDALSALFADVGEGTNLLPAVVPAEPVGVMYLFGGCLMFGILSRINLKPGWGAAFLHRHDMLTRVGVKVCEVDVPMHSATTHSDSDGNLHWISPSDVVCMASVRLDEASCSQRQGSMVFELDLASLERWCKMHILLATPAMSNGNVEMQCPMAPSKSSGKNRRARDKNKDKRHGKSVRI